MATTVTAPVGNVIALAEKYLPILDEIYKVESKSSILDTEAEQIVIYRAAYEELH